MSFSIGGVKLKNGIILAPMAGVTDRAFRTLCVRFGAEYTVSEMVSAKAIHFNDRKTASLADIRKSELPTAVQIFGSEPDIMAEAAERIERCSYNGCIAECPPSAIDINMGCPVRKITANGEGSALMKNPGRIYDIVKAVAASVQIPVTAKIRSGWDCASINAVECALAAEEGGAAAVCVHGRTREQLYRLPVDYDIIAQVKEALSIPVIANGGINCAADALRVRSYTACDGIMVARGAEGNPMIFAEIAAAFENREYTPLCEAELIALAKEHLTLLIADKGEAVALREARKPLSWYASGIRGASSFRRDVNFAADTAELYGLLDRLGCGINNKDTED